MWAAAYEESGGCVSVEEEVEFGSKGRISTGQKRNGNSARFGRATKKWLGISNESITFPLQLMRDVRNAGILRSPS